jgi:hypothetical protein
MAQSILLVGSIGASMDEADNVWTAAYHLTNDAHFRYLQLECDFGITDLVAVLGGLPRSVWDLTSHKSLVRVGASAIHFLGRQLHKQVSSTHVPQQ